MLTDECKAQDSKSDENCRITAKVLTVNIALCIPTSPESTPNKTGRVSLIMVKYDKHPPYAIMSIFKEMK
ncbi:hypothetical protein ACHAXS_009739 [Conticribra weissflogii]